jgi:hypothetical protein
MNLKKLWQWAVTGPWMRRDKDTEYKCEIHGNILKITFMGSSEFTTKGNKLAIDWRHNFDFFVKPYRKMEPVWFAHRGFTRKWRVLESEIFSLIEDNNIEEVFISGFSQGAAIGVLAHESVWFHFPLLRSRLNTIVFGCPRVLWFWNKGKIKRRFENLTRIKSGWDIITSAPPLLFGFAHVGEEKKIGRRWWQISFRFKHNHLHYGDYL